MRRDDPNVPLPEPAVTPEPTPAMPPLPPGSEPGPATEPGPLSRTWPWLLIGAAAAVGGLLPWLLSGARLPLQNLWANDALPAAMPLALLPFSQYSLVTIAALLGVGSVVAGIAFRSLRARAGRGARVSLLGGLLAVQLTAIVQSTLVTAMGLDDGGAAQAYLAVIVGAMFVSLAAGAGAAVLVGWAPRAGALIGLVLAAIMSDSWIRAGFDPLFLSTSPAAPAIATVLRWLPPVLVGVAIAWCGLATVGRVVAGVASLVLLWVLPALITAVSYAFGSRVLLRYPAEVVAAIGEVFRSALRQPEVALPPLVVAVVIAAIGIPLLNSMRRAGRGDASSV